MGVFSLTCFFFVSRPSMNSNLTGMRVKKEGELIQLMTQYLEPNPGQPQPLHMVGLFHQLSYQALCVRP